MDIITASAARQFFRPHPAVQLAIHFVLGIMIAGQSGARPSIRKPAQLARPFRHITADDGFGFGQGRHVIDLLPQAVRVGEPAGIPDQVFAGQARRQFIIAVEFLVIVQVS